MKRATIGIGRLVLWAAVIAGSAFGYSSYNSYKADEFAAIGIKAYKSNNSFDVAYNNLIQALQYNSHNASAHGHLAIVLLHERSYDRAFEHASLAVQYDDRVALHHIALGRALMARREFVAGGSEFEEALRLEPDNRVARNLLANSYLIRGMTGGNSYHGQMSPGGYMNSHDAYRNSTGNGGWQGGW